MNEKRSEVRLLSEDIVVFVAIESLGFGGRRELLCAGGDVSANGLRLFADRAIPVGTICPVRIRLPEQPQEFELVGESIWCKGEPAESVQIGLALLESSQTDIVAWKLAIANRL